ncbi:hypothetical protein, partial [Microvirga sp.]|uniref:hypothetical protein n=1 Tax=Microvirga sp. TaxID=1873136 RepID=UPI001AEE101A
MEKSNLNTGFPAGASALYGAGLTLATRRDARQQVARVRVLQRTGKGLPPEPARHSTACGLGQRRHPGRGGFFGGNEGFFDTFDADDSGFLGLNASLRRTRIPMPPGDRVRPLCPLRGD